jgi:hypothetical protein
MRVAFAVVALGFAAAALFHAIAIAVPQIAEPSPSWRHALFVVVNSAFALGMWKRPRWFVVVFAALTAQQLYGHGTYGLDVWRREARVDWASVLVVVALPIVLALLVRDAVRGTVKARDAVRDGAKSADA